MYSNKQYVSAAVLANSKVLKIKNGQTKHKQYAESKKVLKKSESVVNKHEDHSLAYTSYDKCKESIK